MSAKRSATSIGRDDAEEWTQSLGQSTSGTWRQIALAKRLGVPQALGLSVEQWVDRLGGYVRLNIEDRRSAVAELAANGHSTREIAEVLGVSQSTAARDSSEPNDSPAGATIPAEQPESEPNDSQPVDALAALAVTDDMRAEAERKAANHRAKGTGDNEWYTPVEYAQLARDVLGAIDLDPASCATANRVIDAARFFTAEDDGLVQPWTGRVWLNPPYSQPLIDQFAEKLVACWRQGTIEAAVVLTHNYTDTRWFQSLAGDASAICFTRGRVAFVNAAGVKAAPTQGQAFFYFGRSVDRFAQHFADVGFVVAPAA